MIEHLVPDHTVLTYDRRGWARSADATPATSLDDHADDLLAVLGERRATVVGHSYGGTVSFLAAVRAPERVAALGLFEPSMQWQPWWPSMDAIAAEAPYEQEHFRAGLEGKPRRTREERDREQALLQHELTLIAEAPCHAGRSSRCRASSAGARCRRRGGSGPPTTSATTSTAS